MAAKRRSRRQGNAEVLFDGLPRDRRQFLQARAHANLAVELAKALDEFLRGPVGRSLVYCLAKKKRHLQLAKRAGVWYGLRSDRRAFCAVDSGPGVRTPAEESVTAFAQTLDFVRQARLARKFRSASHLFVYIGRQFALID